VDGLTWQEYETGLEGRLADLYGRVHRGAYRASPSRRVYIPKGDGRQRPLGVAALEDKIVQQAVVTILNAIYAGADDIVLHVVGTRVNRRAAALRPPTPGHKNPDKLFVIINHGDSERA
jgi:retron-type reverse transcriptase